MAHCYTGTWLGVEQIVVQGREREKEGRGERRREGGREKPIPREKLSGF